MRLKTKLVLAATGVTFAIVIMLSVVFLGELLRQRIAQTAGSTDVMARQVLMMTRQAVVEGLRANPPADNSEESLHAAVVDALRSYQPLMDTMRSFILYSSSVQDVSVTDPAGEVLISTDPTTLNQRAPIRMTFGRLQESSVAFQAHEVLGRANVLDISAPLDRNGRPFLIVHVGIRSTFLKNSYLPRLKDGLLLAVLCAVGSMIAAGLLANVASRPIEDIRMRLEQLTASEDAEEGKAQGATEEDDGKSDAVIRVTNTIDRLGRQIRSSEAVYLDLQTNLNQMLDTLRDGVVLFTAEGRSVMVSDAVAHFIHREDEPLMGLAVEEIFPATTLLGRSVRQAFAREESIAGRSVRLEDGREVEFSLDRIDEGGRKMGTLLTLRDKGSAARLEQELEVSRRLAAVGRLTAGVGHEVKNPINAMVVHLELLKAKLEALGDGRGSVSGAQRHVDILAGEMQRLDHVVQTLADFTRPMELRPQDLNLADLVKAVAELSAAEMLEHNVTLRTQVEPVMVHADGDMLRQALLNLVINGMQAMAGEKGHGGVLLISVRRQDDFAVMEIADEGPGIPPELMTKIFDLYFTTKPKGSGIGLAMTYRIVQMHGGAMEVRSEEGQGAVFTVRLPSLVSAEEREELRMAAGRAG